MDSLTSPFSLTLIAGAIFLIGTAPFLVKKLMRSPARVFTDHDTGMPEIESDPYPAQVVCEQVGYEHPGMSAGDEDRDERLARKFRVRGKWSRSERREGRERLTRAPLEIQERVRRYAHW